MQESTAKDLRFRRSSLRRLACLTAAGGALVCGAVASTARAGFTPIFAPPVYENTQAGIFNHVYGGTFTLEGDGVDYTNGSLTAVRISDFLPSTSSSDNPGPNATDQLWAASDVEATVKASFASVPSTPFGYIYGSSGGSFQSLFNITGSGYNVTGTAGFVPSSDPFRFAAENPFGILSSLPSDNTDGKDHMVTYEIDGLGGELKTWLLFFDDYGNMGNNGDGDFQDLVIQVQTLPASSSSVPEPGNLMLVGGLGLGLLTRFRRCAV
jgi:hypothetical protein